MSHFDEFRKSVSDAASNIGSSAAEVGSRISSSLDDASERTVRFRRFVRTGEDLYRSGAVSSHGGNLSESDGVAIWITRTNSMLGHLGNEDVIETSWEPGAGDRDCSRELVVHRAVHHAFQEHAQQTRSAIVHAHALYTIACSLLSDAIVPVDSEGIFLLGEEGVPVIEPAESIGSSEAAEMMAGLVSGGAHVAVIKGHGPFAVAPTMAEALRYVSVLEASCHVIAIRSVLQQSGWRG